MKETHGKCVYCESKLSHVSFGDIEHILPKNKNARPHLVVEWSNLTLACEVCNRSCKRDYYNPDDPLINPYEDEPSEHFRDIGPMIFPMINDRRANVSCEILKLNRAELVNRRTERIQSVNTMLNAWQQQKNPALKDLMANQIEEECGIDKEYSSTIIGFLRDMGFPFSKGFNAKSR